MKLLPVVLFVITSAWFVYNKTKVVDAYMLAGVSIRKWEVLMLISVATMAVSFIWSIINAFIWIGID